jgi:hypothetical protein
MTYVTHHQDFSRRTATKLESEPRAAGKTAGALRRILGAIFQSREEQRDEAIASFLPRSGGRLTDDIEREMTRRETSSNWGVLR